MLAEKKDFLDDRGVFLAAIGVKHLIQERSQWNIVSATT